MSTIKKRLARARILALISSSQRQNISYSNYLGFEGTDQALLLAFSKVYEAILILDCPEWAIKGDKHFRKYFRKFKLKLPDYDFGWLSENLARFWDSFRFTLLEPRHSGALDAFVLLELRSEFNKLFDEMPSRFQYKKNVQEEAIDLTLTALELCLDSNNQLLANPIFEVILILWYHYLYDIAQLKDK